MGLLTTEAEIKINTNNYKNLLSKGYVLPTRINSKGKQSYDYGKTILVKTEDLTNGSHAIVSVQCEECGEITKMTYKEYIKRIQAHGGYYCHKCVMSKFLSGSNSPRWNPLLTDEQRKNGRMYKEYYEFLRRTLARDNYTCQCCGETDYKKLQVHHLDGYAWNVEGRCDETNAATLCKRCHRNFHSEYGNKNNTREQYMQWLNAKQLELKKYDQEIVPSRKVFCYEDNCVYDSASFAVENQLNIKNKSSIYSACNHIHTTAGGKHWFWYDEFLNLTGRDILFYLGLDQQSYSVEEGGTDYE